ncbi:MAG: ribosome maturation factor RimP [Acidiphilium sp.]|jgi:ribosome maturation factor RimP
MHETRPSHTGLEGRIADMIIPGLEAQGYELVRVSIIGRQRPIVQIMADRADGSQISVEDCEKISHLVSARLDVEDPIEGAWTLEVSSAGIDRPLTRLKDWVRFAGHLARVDMAVPTLQGRKRLTGTVLGAQAGVAQLKLDTGETIEVNLADVQRARLVLTDELIRATAQPPAAN